MPTGSALSDLRVPVADDDGDDHSPSASEHVARLRSAIAELYADPYSLSAAQAVRALL